MLKKRVVYTVKGWFFTINNGTMMVGPYRTRKLAIDASYEYIIYGIQEYEAVLINNKSVISPLLN